MKILYVAMKYDYGDESRGLSFEHVTFYDSLVNMGHQLIYFDFMTILHEQGREEMNHRLWEAVVRERPQLLVSVLFRDELDQDTIKRISAQTDTTTLNWFCDDHWRFEEFSSRWAPMFNWVTTTASSALPKYKALGYQHVIKTQWACNHFTYKPVAGPLRYDVTFAGQVYGNRRRVISRLKEAGVEAHAWGFGWENGRLSQEQMISLFSQSKEDRADQGPEFRSPWLRWFPALRPGRRSGAVLRARPGDRLLRQHQGPDREGPLLSGPRRRESTYR
jgi:spore maturation protein CgeB